MGGQQRRWNRLTRGPAHPRVVATIPVGQSPQALVVSSGAVWVSVVRQPGRWRIPIGDSARSVTHLAWFLRSTDPAAQLAPPDSSYETCAGLVTYPDRPAPEGTRLVPDVAQAMPTVSPDGRTYTFIVRPGFRFSPPSDAPVTAATFKHTIERALDPKVGGYAFGFMGDIVGMPAFEAGRTAHLAGITASGTVCRSG